MTYSVFVLAQAKQDFQALYDYISQRSPSGANRWANAYYQALKTLERNPLQCAFAPESARAGQDIRQLIFKTRRGRPYRALFTVRDDAVFIRHLRGPGQDYAQDFDSLPPVG